MTMPAKEVALAVGMYYNGVSLDGVQNLIKQNDNREISESTAWNWVKRFTK